MTNKTRKWIRAGLETLIHGGAAALGSSLSAAMINTHFALFTSNSLKLMGSTFLLNGGLRFVQWWANNPLPPDEDTTPPFAREPQQQISLNPLTKVQQIPNDTKT